MECVEMMALITESPDSAHDALSELKRLEQAGWIDLTYYLLVDLDPAGRILVEESSDPRDNADTLAAGGLAEELIGRLFDDDSSPTALAEAKPAKIRASSQSDGGGLDRAVASTAPGLEPGSSALLLILDERYTERVGQEFETKGRILCKQLGRGERLAALRAAIARMKADVLWLENFLGDEVEKASVALGDQKVDLETTIAAARAELGAQRESLQTRWKMLTAELETELEQTQRTLDASEDGQRTLLESRIREIERSIDDCNEQLASSVLDHMDALAAHAAALEEQATAMNPEAEAAIEAQLHELEVRMRRHRGELTACLGASALRARQCMDRLLQKAAFAPPEMGPSIQEHLKMLNERHSVLKADLHNVEKEETFLWPDSARVIRQSWRALCDSVALIDRQFRPWA